MTFIVPEGARQVVQEDSDRLLDPSVKRKSYNRKRIKPTTINLDTILWLERSLAQSLGETLLLSS